MPRINNDALHLCNFQSAIPYLLNGRNSTQILDCMTKSSFEETIESTIDHYKVEIEEKNRIIVEQQEKIKELKKQVEHWK